MTLLEQAGIFLATAVLLVPLFRRWQLGAVLGYLTAGMLIGPQGLSLVGDVQTTLHFAEFGVVLLLFLIGLELQPARLWVLRRPVFGLGGAQVALTTLVLALAALFLGWSWQASLVTGFGIAMSSTALVIASLAERGQLVAPFEVHHDEAQLIQTTREAADQLRELFEADAVGPLSGFAGPRAPKTSDGR